MYKVADGHSFIVRGIVFAPGAEITEEAFLSKEVFDKKVKAGHIIKIDDKPADKPDGKGAEADAVKKEKPGKGAKKGAELGDLGSE